MAQVAQYGKYVSGFGANAGASEKKTFLKPSSAGLLIAFSISITLVACVRESALAISTCLDWSLLAKGSVTTSAS